MKLKSQRNLALFNGFIPLTPFIYTKFNEDTFILPYICLVIGSLCAFTCAFILQKQIKNQ